MTEEQAVYIVDNDAGVRTSLSMLLESENLRHKVYASAAAFLTEIEKGTRGCLILDIRMPDMNGLQLQLELQKQNIFIPIIFVSGHGDIAIAVRAMRHGALDFISKPYSEEQLLGSIRSALAFEAQKQKRLIDHEELLLRMHTLSKREREVFELVSEGLSNKLAARRLDVSERTIECHRSQVIKKMGAHSLAELVRMRLETERPVYAPIFSKDVTPQL
ncbi:MAG: response regulator transcription factor [Gammaproteobacteria bacterium]